jgi:pimeloyl-ACP methyl ester carboxylesterase
MPSPAVDGHNPGKWGGRDERVILGAGGVWGKIRDLLRARAMARSETSRRAFLFTAAGAALVPSHAFAQAERQAFVAAGAARIHVTFRGQGEPIVLIPSLGRGVDDFDDLSHDLAAAHFQAVMPDPRGFGQSTGQLTDLTLHDVAADVAAVIRSLGRPAVVLGHAYGSRVARMVAVDYPMLVSRVIVLAAGSGKVQRTHETDTAFRRVFDASASPQQRLAAIQRAFFAKGNDARVWQQGWNLPAATVQRELMGTPPLKAWWGGGSAPMLVLQGTEDAVAPSENAQELAAQFPGRIKVVYIPHAGHAMLPEQPERIAMTIIAWLRASLPR